MADKNPRRRFIVALLDDWQCAFDKKFPRGANTRDERVVALRVRIARREDISSILEAAWPYDAKADPKTEMVPALAAHWLTHHAGWVADVFADVVNDAIRELREFKRERRAKLRATYRTVKRRGKRIKIRARGQLPPLTVNVKPVVRPRA